MKPVLLLALCCLAVSPAHAAPLTTDEALRAIEAERSRAIRAGDQAALQKIYSDDFVGIAGDGRKLDRPALLQLLARNDPRLTFTTDEIEVKQIAPTVALMTARLSASGRIDDKDVAFAQRFLHVFVQRDGTWWFVAGAGSVIR